MELPIHQCPCSNQLPTSAPALPHAQRLNLLTLHGWIPVGCRCPPRPPGPPFPCPDPLPAPHATCSHPVSAPLPPTGGGGAQLLASPHPSSISCRQPSLPLPRGPFCCSSSRCLLCCCPRCRNSSGPPCPRSSVLPAPVTRDRAGRLAFGVQTPPAITWLPHIVQSTLKAASHPEGLWGLLGARVHFPGGPSEQPCLPFLLRGPGPLWTCPRTAWPRRLLCTGHPQHSHSAHRPVWVPVLYTSAAPAPRPRAGGAFIFFLSCPVSPTEVEAL